MKKIIITIVALFASFSLYAQSPSLSTQVQGQNMDFETIKTLIKAEKRGVLKENMNLSEAEAEKFWPVYDKYEYDQSKILNEQYALLKEYAESFETLDAKRTDELMSIAFKLNKQEITLNQKYYKQMKKVVSTQTAARFSQIMSQLNTVIDLSMTQELPLINNL
ncbi:hypothetical protein [Flammeovirga kamogawensis]|uniref:Sensor of ECF-type sigma factor n=1 Tax=Flammeovirga kamogawensis TaxID=373891 RepID=A0ABX8GSM3_9BACT|nr:hypothetical protein [Flammeovirga kamogawensis]MBB6463202.1 transposase [Flammeovirga kamogawensis]QWG05945.1 hypothetical protein KM029_11255 [Flammeovirga kamogawensis]TRX67771.1 hypothetical protein EO216_06265 [Flammeovirga kamogawensis]